MPSPRINRIYIFTNTLLILIHVMRFFKHGVQNSLNCQTIKLEALLVPKQLEHTFSLREVSL